MSKTTLLSLFCALLISSLSIAQARNPWSKADEAKVALKAGQREIVPAKYQTFSLDIEVLKEQLAKAVVRQGANPPRNMPIISFPLDNGEIQQFEMEKIDVLHPELGAKYPEISSYMGTSVQNRLNVIHLSLYKNEFRGVITGERNIYMDPYSKGDDKNYIIYNRTDLSRRANDSFVCHTKDEDLEVPESNGFTTAHRSSADNVTRTYRIAIACTSEYSAYYGNTIPNVLAAVNTTITRVNSVYRKEVNMVFQIVPSQNRLIYINEFNIDANPDPDPYDNYDGSGMLNMNTNNINGLITSAAYDIGHVFSTGGGGIAGIGPCGTNKGAGVTGIVTPQYDPFDIDYVCHEIGHQFSAGHTYYNACFGAKVNEDYEPGSASTIMGYAGICAPNVQANSDAYFHATSIAKITTAMSGHNCEVESANSNTGNPTASAGLDYNIPKGTPFVLTGSGSDSNTSDVLTYCWEQWTITDGGTQPPTPTNTAGPQFRSLFPTTSPSRYFPNLEAVIANTTPTWEVLPNVARTLAFRLTVRDNHPTGGRTNFDDMNVIIANSGPFVVTAPNTAETWYVGESKTVTWNVANTTASPVSTSNVAIKLSTDGGYTYPVTLLASTPNDGSQAITVPNNIGKQMRIKVEAVGNIYYDISNTNFEIKASSFELTTANATVATCKPANAVFNVTFTKAPNFAHTVTFSAVGLPAGSTASFNPTTRTATGNVAMTVSGISNLATGIYNFTFRGTSSSATIDLPLTLKVVDNNIQKAVLLSPDNGAENQQTSTLLSWQDLSSASSYRVELSYSPVFQTIVESATVTTPQYQTSSLTAGNIVYWRVKPINACIEGTYSETFVFQIAADVCRDYNNVYFENNDNIWNTGSNNAVSARIDVPDDIEISDVNFTMTATHPSMTDIKMQFSGPTGIFVEIYNRDCSGANVNVTFDDEGTPIPVPCSGGLTGTRQSSQPLSKFDGSSSLGTWVLLATDRVSNTSGGTFTGLKVSICGKLQYVNDVSALISDRQITSGQQITLGNTVLAASQPTALASELVYTLTRLPSGGALKRNGSNLILGNTFTQADVNNNLITYTHSGANTADDNFAFSVIGKNNALLGGLQMNFEVCDLLATESQTNVTCNGQTNGTATVVVSGGTPVYTYSWAPMGGTAATASNLPAGNYTCTITDATGCTLQKDFTITQPSALTASISGTNISCWGGANGTANMVVSGGTAPYTYDWSPGTPNGDGTASASFLSTGTYTCVVTDANGCTVSRSIQITQPTVLSLSMSKTDLSCFGNATGSATVSASGGTGPYTYDWTPGNPAGDGTATVTGLAAGLYTVNVSDIYGCTRSMNVTILQPSALSVSTWNVTNIACYGGSTGSATVYPTGGTAPYTFDWGPGNPAGDGTNSVSGLSAGNYTCTITDANNCFIVHNVTISQSVSPMSTTLLSSTNVSCYGGANGSATIGVTGGVGGYTFDWAPGNPIGDGSPSVIGLAAGNYTCTVTDANGCYVVRNIFITQPSTPLSLTPAGSMNVSCYGGSNGNAAAQVSGGTPPYTFDWSPGNPIGDGSPTAFGLSAGTYTLTATDVNGCSAATTFVIQQPAAPLTISGSSQTNLTCFGSANGAATVLVTGGTGVYSYSWGPGVLSGNGTPTVTGLSAGTYTCTVADSNGCTTFQTFVITQPAVLTASQSQVDLTCNENNGSASVTPSGGVGPYEYSWFPTGGTSATATNLAAGTYTCTITDANECSITRTFIIEPTLTTTWTSSGWTNGVPVSGMNAIIDFPFTATADLTACTLEVTGDAIVTVPSGFNFHITNKVTVAPTATLTFENNANLLQIDNIANIGKITSKRSTFMKRQDYTYWSSPVMDQNLKLFSPMTVSPPIGNSRFYILDEPTNAFVAVDPIANSFSLAKGYMIRAPNDFPNSSTAFTGKFTGVPHNGNISIPVTISDQVKGYNMIGNPYPSPVDAYLFLATNPGTLYFWTHRTQVSGDSNYATFNNSGGVAAIPGEVIPNGFIQTAQGFLYRVANSGVASFTNSMRASDNEGQFFRNANAPERHRFWLNLHHADTPLNQIMINYMEGATLGFDNAIDGPQMQIGATSIATLINGEPYAIQGRSLPFSDTDVVAVKFNATTAGSYSISLDAFDGLFAEGQQIYIRDLTAAVTHNLSQTPYNFISDAGSFLNRFEIVYQNTTLPVDNPEAADNIVITKKDDRISVYSNEANIAEVTVFDTRGRLLFNSKVNNLAQFHALDFVTEQVLLVKVKTASGFTITKKVL